MNEKRFVTSEDICEMNSVTIKHNDGREETFSAVEFDAMLAAGCWNAAGTT